MCNSNLSEGSEMNLAGESHYIVLMDNKLAQDTGNLTQYSKPRTGQANSWRNYPPGVSPLNFPLESGQTKQTELELLWYPAKQFVTILLFVET